MEVKYCKCAHCFNVYDSEEKECTRCKTPRSIQEGNNTPSDEKIFNLCDGD